MINTNTIIYAQSLKERLREVTERDYNSGGDALGEFVQYFLAFALPLSVVCVFLLLSFSAFKIITSKGDPEKLKEAKEQISSAIIGFIFVVLSIAILALLSNILGLNFVDLQ